MRKKILRLALRGALALPLLLAVAAAPPTAAGHAPVKITYQITELPTPEGGAATGVGINDAGLITGHTRQADGQMRATIWRNGVAEELGTLGGRHSAILWPVKNSQGIVVGIAETADPDPRGEAWSCAAFFGEQTEHTCVGFVWKNGTMRPLPTFGGNHGFATGLNNRGQAVGWAELAEPDPTCNQVNQFLGFRAALWDVHTGRMRELSPLPGDSASAATAINDRGQAVGISGDCANAVGGFSARHAVLWDKGKVIEIGDLGGEAWNTPMAINARGTVVGFANQAHAEGSAFFEEAFSWTARGGVRGLGWLDGDVRSQALGLNDWGQTVGLSRGPAGDTAVIWRGGGAVDLNSLAPGYDGHLVFANDVNNAGVITGRAVNAAGQPVAFVARPTLR